MASTYPLEVIAAARWSQANPNVTGDALQTAMQQQPWDPSVKALTALPQTLQMMSDKLEWTQQLGDAFLAQQSDVLNAVQQLRARADANGQLKSTPEQKVTTTPRPAAQRSSTAHVVEAAPANVYAIESTNPDEYYVPIYDPGVVYGSWPYPDYSPYYWYPPGYAAGNVFSFATGVLVGSAIWGNINWNRNFVQINPLRYNNFNRTNIANGNWTHNPAHRGAVPYRDAGVANDLTSRAIRRHAKTSAAKRTRVGASLGSWVRAPAGASRPEAGRRAAGQGWRGKDGAGHKLARRRRQRAIKPARQASGGQERHWRRQTAAAAGTAKQARPIQGLRAHTAARSM
jgi:hypothetical protein